MASRQDESIRLWSVRSGACAAVFAGDQGHISEVLFVDMHRVRAMPTAAPHVHAGYSGVWIVLCPRRVLGSLDRPLCHPSIILHDAGSHSCDIPCLSACHLPELHVVPSSSSANAPTTHLLPSSYLHPTLPHACPLSPIGCCAPIRVGRS